ncbi:MAG: sugar kinase [Rhizomicrobium sp.]
MNSGLLCVGLTTLDIAGRPIDAIPAGASLIEGVALSPAGTAGGTALIAAALGVRTALASAIGDDGAGRFVRSELEAKGVDTRFLATLPRMRTSTTILAIRSDGERPLFHAPGASQFARIDSETFAAAQTSKFVHWAGIGGRYLDGGPAADLLAAAKTAGATVTCDLIGPGKHTMAELERVLPHVDFFMPNMDEALLLAETDVPQKAAERFFAMGAETCILKWGRRGAMGIARDRRFDIPAHEIQPVDTTSCGDSFCAGFIAALDRGHDIRDACRFASATAALVAQDLGTLGKLADYETTSRYMTETPLRSAI